MSKNLNVTLIAGVLFGLSALVAPGCGGDPASDELTLNANVGSQSQAQRLMTTRRTCEACNCYASMTSCNCGRSKSGKYEPGKNAKLECVRDGGPKAAIYRPTVQTFHSTFSR